MDNGIDFIHYKAVSSELTVFVNEVMNTIKKILTP